MGAGTGAAQVAPTDEDREERIRALRRRVYGPNVRPEDVTELAALLAEAEPPEREAEPAVRPVVLVGDEGEDVGPAPSPPALRLVSLLRALPPRLALAAAAVAVLSALAGAGVIAAVAGPTSADAADRTVPRFSPAVTVAADPRVLDRRVAQGDRPSALVGPDLVTGSFRRLGAYPFAGVTFWAARDRFGQTCLVAADIFYRTACADPATFASEGVVLEWSTGPDWPGSTTTSYTALWRDGRLTAGRTP